MSHEHSHHCGALFGCGEERGTGVVRQDLAEWSYTPRAADRLTHMDHIDRGTFDGYLTARGRSRRDLLKSSAFMGVLAAIGPWFARPAFAADGGG
ncbi:MAG TPA: twin-arginine translocation signal domain-containing protein, partial [Alphaproteobacteria bacterium]|nr:twin-arginine translocation signal domain-containing protein [Alphaproteobacteria bacterium]